MIKMAVKITLKKKTPATHATFDHVGLKRLGHLMNFTQHSIPCSLHSLCLQYMEKPSEKEYYDV